MPDIWKQLAIDGLHFECHDVKAVELDNHTAMDRCRDMLGKWLAGHGERGPRTWSTLLQALMEIGQTELAKELQGKHSFPISENA